MSLQSESFLPNSSFFNKLTYTYLFEQERLTEYFAYPTSEYGIKTAIQNLQSFEFDRDALSEDLLLQAKTVDNTTQNTTQNINLLKNKNTFCITTGHQLCLMTGPLYFIYKIAAVIQLSETLNKKYTDYKFVPVFWMASEDHDIEEINHFNFKGTQYRWETNKDTFVANLNTEKLDTLYLNLTESKLFPETFLKLFQEAYLKEHTSYVDAMRYLINYLFGNKGLIIIDGNNKTLKQQFSDIFYQDIFSKTTHQIVEQTNQLLLSNNYEPQVNPRMINTFLLQNEKRHLIIPENENFVLKDTTLKFSKNEMENLLAKHPEQFSPNVLLRPVYQQKILPNLIYIGGSAELSYWLQLKQLFDKYKVFYPIIIQRPIIFLENKKTTERLTKLNISSTDLLLNKQDAVFKNILQKNNLTINLNKQKTIIEQEFQIIADIAENVDKTLIAFVKAEQQKSLNALNIIEQKLNKSIKQKNEILDNQLKQIYSIFYPNTTMQDRVWNLSDALLYFGDKFIDEIYPHCNINIEEQFKLKIIKQI